jgi:hypothetical protein
MHDVTVGEYEAIGGENEPRPMPARLLWDTRVRGLPPLEGLVNFEVEDCSTDPFRGRDYGARIGVKEFIVRERGGA